MDIIKASIERPTAVVAAIFMTIVLGFIALDRIEVLRGPQGTLFGQNSTGGTVNVINTAPTFEPD